MSIEAVVNEVSKREHRTIDLRYGSLLTRMDWCVSIITFRAFERILEESTGSQGHDIALELAHDVRTHRWPSVSDAEYAHVCELADPFIKKTQSPEDQLSEKEQRAYNDLRRKIDRRYCPVYV